MACIYDWMDGSHSLDQDFGSLERHNEKHLQTTFSFDYFEDLNIDVLSYWFHFYDHSVVN